MGKFIRIIAKFGFKGEKKYFIIGIILSSFYIVFNSAVPYLFQKWINSFLTNGNMSYLYKFGLLFALAIIIVIISDYIGAYVLILLREKLRYSLRKHLIKEIIFSSEEQHAEKRSGYYTQVLMNDVEKLTGVIVSSVYMILPAVIGLPAAIVFASLISPVFTIAGVVGFALLTCLIYGTAKALRKLSEERQEYYAKLGEVINELIKSSLIIKIFDALNPVLFRKEKYFSGLKNVSVRKNSYAYMIQVISEFIRNIIEIGSVFITLIYASSLHITSAGIMAGIVYLSRIWQPTVLMEEINEEFQTAFASAERLYKLTLKKEKETNNYNRVKINKITKIEIKNVSLFYGNKLISNGISSTVKNGECLGIVGISGSGKTTLAKAILGLHRDFDGEILINDVNIKNIGNVHSYIGYLPQFVPLFTDTLQFNIALSENVNKDRLFYAVKNSGLEDFLRKLPDGVNSIISEKSVSGGERKRIGMARLFYRKYDALILDEPFSGIDKKTSEGIYNKIMTSFRDKILIIISHNKIYTENCGKTLFLKSC